ncbi:hypothetical protein FO519_001823 [Halicephalobus sp. NKZ332]|nr:hypothetical protein FO519_001823 [Halicephalobus sp. NKZ332]
MSPRPNFVGSGSTELNTILVDVDASDDNDKKSRQKKNKRNSPSPVLFSTTPNFFSNFSKRLPALLVSVFLVFAIYKTYTWGIHHVGDPTIIVITPTHKRPARLADMTRLSQTLMHVKNIHWVVIEDSNHTVDAVERILKRSGIPYVYFFTTTKPGYPKRGWTHRNMGLEYVRKNYKNYKRGGVVYFADDDNSYDVRIFDNYIRNVKDIGIWAVGLAGAAAVEAPHVVNGTITKWDVVYAPGRKGAPESCFLSQFGMNRVDVTPFGWNEEPKDILVWHTKTSHIGHKGGHHNYTVEI